MTSSLIAQLALVLVRISEEVPEDKDIKAGWTAFVIFFLLIGAVVLLGFSLTKHLRRAAAAEEAGLYGSDESDKDGENSGAEPRQAP